MIMENFTFYSPACFVFGKDAENQAGALVKSLCRGDGRTGSISGFVTLNEDDCANIYRLMV